MGKLLQRISKTVRDFKDFDLRFTRNPLTNDLAARIDEDAVKDSVRNIVLTGRHEKKFFPSFGGGVYNLLFEPWNPLLSHAWATNIKDEVNAYEPRARDVVVTIKDLHEKNLLEIQVEFWAVNVNEPITVTEFLYRTR
jgi:phage baseplate assembly protein W